MVQVVGTDSIYTPMLHFDTATHRLHFDTVARRHTWILNVFVLVVPQTSSFQEALLESRDMYGSSCVLKTSKAQARLAHMKVLLEAFGSTNIKVVVGV